MQVEGVSFDLTIIMHEQAFGDYLTYHSFLPLESVGWRTGYNRLAGYCILVGSSQSAEKSAIARSSERSAYYIKVLH